jgi:nucleoside-diphosphate-sugar epimerase
MMSNRVAVLGANGFIGCRTVELLHLSGWAGVVPVVRRPDAFAGLSRFALEGRIADARNEEALTAAFVGCQYVVHCVAGDPHLIVDAIEPAYRAATAAGVRRLIYLSSASVHGQSPATGANEASQLDDNQSIEYNNAKIRAERLLNVLSKDGAVEIVVLRPGIVFGPRSSWTGGFADELIDGTAYLVEGGKGICNSVYVDNVVHAIQLAMHAPQVGGQTYLVTDDECITWADLCRPVATALGFDLEAITVPMPVSFNADWKQRLRESDRLRSFFKRLPKPLRSGLKAGYAEWSNSRRGEVDVRRAGPVSVSEERALLHRCQTKLRSHKAERELGYRPIVNFREASRRSVGWLTFAGYPTAAVGIAGR